MSVLFIRKKVEEISTQTKTDILIMVNAHALMDETANRQVDRQTQAGELHFDAQVISDLLTSIMTAFITTALNLHDE